MERPDQQSIQRITHDTDILIIGGGTSGCLAATEIKEKYPHLSVTIVEKAHVDRSGCLAAGMNAINAYLNPGETPESFVKYVRYDSCGLIREDLVQSMAELFEYSVKKVEGWGLPILCDESGNYAPRGRWNIKINGESLKPIIAKAARDSGAKIHNWVVVTDLLMSGERCAGAVGFSLRHNTFYTFRAKATIVATGGAAGLYKPNNAYDAQHKTWYSPFNNGAGYAMGIRAGAEMTSFEMRYVALRTKDAIAPTGTLALGVNAPLVNSKGERFMQTRYAHLGGDGAPTPYRAYGPIQEVKAGRGPCYLDTTHITDEQSRQLKMAYLDMYPSQVLYWAANDIDPARHPVEVQTTEPYIVGGHCQGGYWVDIDRQSTVPGLYAAGDVAGGAPFKFVSGCWAEGILAARHAGKEVQSMALPEVDHLQVETAYQRCFDPLFNHGKVKYGVKPYDMEVRMQKIMEEYAGGTSQNYEMNEERLQLARKYMDQLPGQFDQLVVADMHDLMRAHEVMDRVVVGQVLIEHLMARKETRWPSYQTRTDYPERDDLNWLKFVNTRRDRSSGKIEVLFRPYQQLVPGDRYHPGAKPHPKPN
ncbi:MAG: adenylyl-sulfate reductase subunit alpha [Nitrospirota bacterium]|nr:adenylyl-sulfate reductase subunit alpha [Nitrospirota bacterium]